MTRTIFPLLLLVLLLSACAVTLTPATSAGVVVTSSDATFSPLPHYPGSVVTRQEHKPNKAELEFRAAASTDAVFSFYDRHLLGRGWQVTKVDVKKNGKVEAEYSRAGDKAKLKVEWKKDRYKVELKA